MSLNIFVKIAFAIIMSSTINNIINTLEQLPDIISVRYKNNSYTQCIESRHITAMSLFKNSLDNCVLNTAFCNLQYLYIDKCSKLEEILFETPLPKLEYLVISNCNALSTIKIPKGCIALKTVYIRSNALIKIELEGNCPALEFLDISENILTNFSLPNGFSNLVYFYLNGNQLKTLTLPSSLAALEILHLRGNQLQELPNNILLFENLDTLYLYGNPLSSLPKEILSEGERGNSLENVKAYLHEFQKGTIINYRAKLIIVGNGRVGKTSMYRRLKNLSFNSQEPYTHGIELSEHNNLDKRDVPDVKTDQLQLSVWDFGGQQIFYATHQFFLSEDALYILSWTNRKNVLASREQRKEILDFDDNKWYSSDYWLENIRLHSKNSPILMVQTHSDNIENYQTTPSEYAENPYNAVLLDFSALNDDGLIKLKKHIADRLNKAISMFGKKFPKTYDNVINSIKDLRKIFNTISITQFSEICQEAQISEGSERVVLEYLDKTGVVIYFDKPLLKDVVYINPNWLTEKVYKIISPELKSKKGRIDNDYLKKVLPYFDDEFQRTQFIELLKNFELIFETQKGDKVFYIAPLYLPDELNEEAQEFFDSIFLNSSLAFIFRFPKFVPENVMINFLCRYGPFSKKSYWKNGIHFINEKNVDCIVLHDETQKSLLVYTQKGQDSEKLQKEVCQAFVELSKYANAEISVDGKNFASWQDLTKHYDIYLENPEHIFLSVDKSNPLSMKDFIVFFNNDLINEEINKQEVSSTKSINDVILEVVHNREFKLDRLKILFLGANPFSTGILNLKGEYAEIAKRLEDSKIKDRLDIRSNFSTTLEDFQEKIDKFKPQIIHFAGHGEDNSNEMADFSRGIQRIDWRDEAGLVFFDNDHRKARYIGNDTLDYHFETFIEIDKIPIEVVILNACYSVNQAKVIAKRVKYVIGVNNSIKDDASIDFTSGFYYKLAESDNIIAAFRYGKGRALPKLKDRNHIVLFIDGQQTNN